MLTSARSLLAATILAGSVFAAAPALAQEVGEFTVSGNATLVTDYRFRGISLTDGDFAIQGGVDVVHSSGFYVGTWASSLEDSAVYGNAELDIYAGWSGEVSSGLTLDAGVLYYAYPNGKDVAPANIWEPYASISADLGPVSATVGAAYAWEQDSLGGDDNLYVYTDLGVGVPNTPISLAAHLGYTDGALSPKILTGTSTGGGFDWSIGASYAITENLSFGVTYVGVQGDSIDSFSNDAVVASIGFAF
jgi:uncharacterized protein (TIGR02001 family)